MNLSNAMKVHLCVMSACVIVFGLLVIMKALHVARIYDRAIELGLDK